MLTFDWAILGLECIGILIGIVCLISGILAYVVESDQAPYLSRFGLQVLINALLFVVGYVYIVLHTPVLGIHVAAFVAAVHIQILKQVAK